MHAFVAVDTIFNEILKVDIKWQCQWSLKFKSKVIRLRCGLTQDVVGCLCLMFDSVKHYG